MSRRTFLRHALAALAVPAFLTAAGCGGGGSGVEKPATYSGPPEGAASAKNKAKDRGVGNVKTE
jgi:hypothetical protein